MLQPGTCPGQMQMTQVSGDRDTGEKDGDEAEKRFQEGTALVTVGRYLEAIQAFEKALEWGDRIPTGILYRVERPVFEDSLWRADGIPLVKRKLDPQKAASLMKEFI